ncbi:TIGR04086 family membrane protein [Saliterribacillus persicus]|uniref:Putative membrane protein (TIGR04086 family) n=1 Tax=Saliterribacillus persicus TaxID=930114 RepID=A0A368XEP6_9BACI|nr:TIGR04086 family membrane protein [Saliterribacillus persicus]RCW66433.1 putative membrane protein (TIGR04086 family) [Saliterribacillus persicus]
MNHLKGVLYGWLAIFSIFIFSSIILAMIFRFTSLGEGTLMWSTLIISFVALWIGGFVAGLKAKRKAWWIGASTSLSFSFFLFIYQFQSQHELFSVPQVVQHLAYLLLCIFGAIISVNISQTSTPESHNNY